MAPQKKLKSEIYYDKLKNDDLLWLEHLFKKSLLKNENVDKHFQILKIRQLIKL